jgi:hypothetical protein
LVFHPLNPYLSLVKSAMLKSPNIPSFVNENHQIPPFDSSEKALKSKCFPNFHGFNQPNPSIFQARNPHFSAVQVAPPRRSACR